MRGHRLGRHSGESSDCWPSLLVLIFPSQSVESLSSLSLWNALCPVSWLHPSSWAVTWTCSKPPGDSRQKQSSREHVPVSQLGIITRALWVQSPEHFPWWASAALLAEQSQKSPSPEAECCVCKWEILPSTFLICYQWSPECPKQNKPQRIKSTENAAFRPRKPFAVADCLVHSWDTTCICGQPLSLPQQLPRHFWAWRGALGTWASPHHAGKAPGTAWPVGTRVPLCWRCWGGASPWVKGRGPRATGSGRGRKGWRQCRQLPPRDSSSDASEWSLLEDVLSVISETGCDFNSSFSRGRPVASSTALASVSAANLADVCAERTCHKDTMTQSRQCHTEGATSAGMGNQGSLSLGTLASM